MKSGVLKVEQTKMMVLLPSGSRGGHTMTAQQTYKHLSLRCYSSLRLGETRAEPVREGAGEILKKDTRIETQILQKQGLE